MNVFLFEPPKANKGDPRDIFLSVNDDFFQTNKLKK
jgi:hypothetical protein